MSDVSERIRDREETGPPTEFRVVVDKHGCVFVRAPAGLQSMRIVTGPDRMPGAVAHRVSELLSEILHPGLAGPPAGTRVRTRFAERLLGLFRRPAPGAR